MSKMPGYKYVVVYQTHGMLSDRPYWTSILFQGPSEAAKFADGHRGARVYGLNPEYGVVSAALSLEY